MNETGKEYAEALFALASEENELEEITASVGTLKELFTEAPDYLEFLSSPAVPVAERTAAVEEALGNSLPEHTVSFVKLLCERGRIGEIFSCIKEYEALYQYTTGVTKAYVTSAAPLSDKQKKALTVKLERLLGHRIELSVTVDPTLIGGLTVEADGQILEGSLKHRLDELHGLITANNRKGTIEA